MARRLRRRGHLDQRPGTVDVLLDELVSPLRYDVVVRQQFFAFLDANAELLDEFSDLVIEARGQPYFLWYRDIVIGERTKLLKGRTSTPRLRRPDRAGAGHAGPLQPGRRVLGRPPPP